MDNGLKILRKRRGLTQDEAAALFGMSKSGYIKLERGERRLTDTHITKAVEVFGGTAGEVLGSGAVAGASTPSGVPIPPGHLRYGGTVAAGDWLTVDDFNQDLADTIVPASIPRHPAYPKLEQIAWRVQGDSMDRAGILDGMWIVGASYADYVDKVGELDNGNFVIVERSRYGGSERELTVKEVQFARRGMRLVPRSSDPRHREFFIDLDESADPDTETVRILGVVLWAGRDLAPSAR